MKKSEALRLAIYTVINSESVSGEMKVKILRCLYEEERTALLIENSEDKSQED